MAKLLRSSLPDGFFHVVSRGVFGARLYLDDADRSDFVRLLERCIENFRWECWAYCLMTTHYHLVVEAGRQHLSDGIQHLNGCHALSFNRRHERYGALFAERFSARVIESEEYLYEACIYVLLNPVNAGICDSFEMWPWSYNRFDATTATPSSA